MSYRDWQNHHDTKLSVSPYARRMFTNRMWCQLKFTRHFMELLSLNDPEFSPNVKDAWLAFHRFWSPWKSSHHFTRCDL